MSNFYKGIAGKRNRSIKGVVIHNDAGSSNANAAFYRNWLQHHNAENGFAHVYIANDGRYQAEDYDNMAWHTANSDGNANYVGWEVCQSMGDREVFLANEQAVFKDIASFMKARGMVPNRDTVKLHKEFSATTCPHRSCELHGTAIENVRSYYIEQIKKYMNGTSGTESNAALPTTQNTGNGEITMVCIYRIEGNNTTYYFDGEHIRGLANPHELEILNNIYKANNGKNIPDLGVMKKNYRLDANLQALLKRKPIV